MTPTSCSSLTLYYPVKESPNTHVQSHSISAIPPLLPHTHTHSTMQVRKERRRGITTLFEMLNVVCSADVNNPQDYSMYDMRRAFRRHAQWLNASKLNGCQTTILRNKHMTTRNCYYFTRTFLCKSHLTHIFNHTRYPLFPPLLLHTHTHSTM